METGSMYISVRQAGGKQRKSLRKLLVETVFVEDDAAFFAYSWKRPAYSGAYS